MVAMTATMATAGVLIRRKRRRAAPVHLKGMMSPDEILRTTNYAKVPIRP